MKVFGCLDITVGSDLSSVDACEFQFDDQVTSFVLKVRK